MSSAMPAPGTESHLEEQDQLDSLWHCVLLDDDDHTYEYVIEMLVRIFFKTIEEAYNHAVEVDSTGRTIVLTCEKDAAEFAKSQIQNFGADPRMERSKGSMSAVVERA